MNQNLTFLLFLLLVSNIIHGQVDFELPEKVCTNTPFNVVNKSNGASSYYWSFCVADLNSVPLGTNLGNVENKFSLPVFMDFVFDNGNYFGFVTNHSPGGLTRLDFGSSLLNNPTATYLGDFGGILPTGVGTEGIQIVKNEGRWYAIIVGGNPNQGSQPRIIKLDFGANINNPSPMATNWGNIGNMNQPIDLHLFQEDNNWYGFTVNSENNTITRFAFTSSFNNIPIGINLGNIGSLNYPTGVYTIFDKGKWFVFVVNGGPNQTTGVGSSLTRLDFGSTLLNTPTGVNLGNPGNILQHPRDITIMKSCGQIVGFAVNGRPGFNDIVRIDFKNELLNVPTLSSLGNVGQLNFPHSISKIFRAENDLFMFVTNVSNNTISRIKFAGCTNSNIPNSTQESLPPITYNFPGTYNINLTIDEGLPTQATLCKQITVIKDTIVQDFSYKQETCNPLRVQFFNSDNLVNIGWNFGDGTVITNTDNPFHVYSTSGTYPVKMWSTSSNCGNVDTLTRSIIIQVDSVNIILNQDTTLCNGTVQMRSTDAVEYCWSPTTYLSNPTISNPVATPLQDITYRLISKTLGANLVVNGSFTSGNIGFKTDYKFANSNTTEGEYWVGNSPVAWNSALSTCSDHTGSNGNMLLVNGSPTENMIVWQQTINVAPNTNYEFSTWLQALYFVNPAQLQFSINGVNLGSNLIASLPTCTWLRFFTMWNSGSSTTATISIVNRNTMVQGNDFALDDISFSQLSFKSDSVRITIEKPSVKAGNDTLVCHNSVIQLAATGAEKYSWSPAEGISDYNISNPFATITKPAQYIVTGFTPGGCQANDTINISVLASPTIMLSNDTTICDLGNKIQLKAEGGISYEWYPTLGLNNPSIPNPIASPLVTSSYNVKVTGDNTCTAIDSVTIRINRLPEVRISNDTSLCYNYSIKLKAEGGVSYQWLPSTGLDNPGIAEPTAHISTPIVYVVRVTDLNNCYSEDSVELGVLSLPDISRSNDTAVCNNRLVPLFASGGVSYKWTPVTGLSNPDSFNPVASLSESISYTITVVGSNGCSGADSVNIEIYKSPLVKVTKDTSVCTNASIELSASGASSYQWFPLNEFSNPNSPNQTISPLEESLFWVIATDNHGCDASDTVKVSIRPAAAFGLAETNIKGCAGQPIQLEAFGGDIYEWSPAIGLNDSGIRNPVAILNSGITYSLLIRESVCNEDTILNVPIEVVALGNIKITKSNDITCNTPATILSASGGNQYYWQPEESLTSSRIPNPVATPEQTTMYVVSVIGEDGCVGKDSVEVKVNLVGDFKIFQMPNAFTPNRDGLNDCFGIGKWGSVEIIYFDVFNRWGQRVFVGNSTYKCWDGRFNGVDQPSGIYIYKIRAKTICGEVERYGNISLIR